MLFESGRPTADDGCWDDDVAGSGDAIREMDCWRLASIGGVLCCRIGFVGRVVAGSSDSLVLKCRAGASKEGLGRGDMMVLLDKPIICLAKIVIHKTMQIARTQWLTGNS